MWDVELVYVFSLLLPGLIPLTLPGASVPQGLLEGHPLLHEHGPRSITTLHHDLVMQKGRYGDGVFVKVVIGTCTYISDTIFVKLSSCKLITNMNPLALAVGWSLLTCNDINRLHITSKQQKIDIVI